MSDIVLRSILIKKILYVFAFLFSLSAYSQKKLSLHDLSGLSGVSNDKTYGYSSANPIKVGTGYGGGPNNEKRYFLFLRDAQGNPVKHKMIASCCPYPITSGFLGTGMLDVFEVTFLDKKGKEKKVKLYLTFYEYDDPKAPKGFIIDPNGAAGKKQ